MTTQAAEAETRELVEELRHRVSGEVRFDRGTRALYSTDASIYQIEPLGVVLPRSAEDVVAVVETARRHGVAVLPRGGGTSLAGQTVGRAIVVDFTPHMHDVLEVSPEERWARVQPGIVLDVLNRRLAPHRLLFAPDPSTSNRATVGGALGNNSCGAHSLLWGKSVDNVAGMDVVLSDGHRAGFGPLDEAGLEARRRAPGLEGEIYRTLQGVGNATRDEVAARYPRIPRRVSGYNLDELADPRRFDGARFLVGSEGTLATVVEARLRLVPQPTMRAQAVLHFHDLIEATEATLVVLETGPAAVELIGSMILRQVGTNLAYSRLMDFVEGKPEALLVVEVLGDTEAEVEARLSEIERRAAAGGLGYAVRRLVRPEDQAKVWAIRRAGLGLMMNVAGPAKPLPFVEDTAVAPEVLPQFVRRFDAIVREHGTTAGYYGHAGAGCLHIRPLIDLKRQDGVDRMVSIATAISDLVLEFGGSMSGEHGDGLARSVWNEKMFGPVIYSAFRDVKAAFDPAGIMNPGKLVDPPPMTDNLRISPAYRPADVETGFSFEREGGFAAAIERCNGQGECRKRLGGTMCPSYMATLEEEHSTRGRANALRAAISGALPIEELTGQRLHDVLDLCLECKACKAECPSNVDMAKLKYEFLHQYHRAHGQTIRNRIFGNLPALSRLGCFLAPVSNWVLGSETFRVALEAAAGIDRRRPLPPFASQTFRQWFRARGASDAAPASRGQVLLFTDTFTDFNHPEVGKAATTVLERLGYQVVVPPWRCCGRPALAAGMLDRARANARANVEAALPYVERGVKLVGLEPGCLLSFRDDYLDLLPGDPGARQVADAALLVEELLVHDLRDGRTPLAFARPPGRALFHGHCHQKALVGTRPAMEALRSVPGCDPVEVNAGCCGMAGSFGFAREHYDVSMRIGEQGVLPAVRAEPPGTVVVAEGVSCRQQIEHGTGRRAIHLVEILAAALEP